MTFNLPEVKTTIAAILETATDTAGVVFHQISTSILQWDTTLRLLLFVPAPATHNPGWKNFTPFFVFPVLIPLPRVISTGSTILTTNHNTKFKISF